MDAVQIGPPSGYDFDAAERDDAREGQPGAWLDSKQVAAYLASSTEGSFEKISAKTDIPMHRLTDQVILYNQMKLVPGS